MLSASRFLVPTSLGGPLAGLGVGGFSGSDVFPGGVLFRETPSSAAVNFRLFAPLGPALCSFDPVLVRGMVTDESIFKTGK